MVDTHRNTNQTSLSAIQVENLDLHYHKHHALKALNLEIMPNEVTAFIGPSGCGKSTLLRCLNRMNDRIPGVKISGRILVDGTNPYAPKTDVTVLRRNVGMVFQKPNPFPMSIYENVAMAPRTHFGLRGSALDQVVEASLRRAAIWDEVKDTMRRRSAMELSGGQQQRLCIARALAVEPSILLLDEPCSALDPISSEKIEQLMVELGREYTIVVVTHNLQQARRVSHRTAFFMLGKLIEDGPTEQMFQAPAHAMTADYVQGRFG